MRRIEDISSSDKAILGESSAPIVVEALDLKKTYFGNVEVRFCSESICRFAPRNLLLSLVVRERQDNAAECPGRARPSDRWQGSDQWYRYLHASGRRAGDVKER